jgi:hypothetical protein
MRAGLFRGLRAAVAIVALCALAGCGTVNSALTTGMADYVPQWAGGLPADAPPRPGTARYDAYMKEQERLRAMSATEREQYEAARAAQTGQPPSATAPPH